MRAIKLIGYMLKIFDLPLNESIKNEMHVTLHILGQMYESTILTMVKVFLYAFKITWQWLALALINYQKCDYKFD